MCIRDSCRPCGTTPLPNGTKQGASLPATAPQHPWATSAASIEANWAGNADSARIDRLVECEE
eukprot:5942269-Alexandrium_andersonii.AAC.1